jgi:hypothetical protein
MALIGKVEAEKIIDSFMDELVKFARKEVEQHHTEGEVNVLVADFVKSPEYKDLRNKTLNILSQATRKE